MPCLASPFSGRSDQEPLNLDMTSCTVRLGLSTSWRCVSSTRELARHLDGQHHFHWQLVRHMQQANEQSSRFFGG